jgi:hypothetical protein
VKNIRWTFAIVLVMLSGCVTVSPMAFDKTSKQVDVSAKSVVLMTFDVSRADDSRYVPRPVMLNVKKLDSQTKDDQLHFRMSEKEDRFATTNGQEIYAMRMALDPGRYQLTGVGGIAGAFPFVGNFFVPLLLDFVVSSHSVVYAGHVQAKLRPRQEGEFRAGPMIPLIDQAVTGVSTGTFDVTVEDSSIQDIALFRSTYPALADIPVGNALLPSFDRAKVQRLRDGDKADVAGKDSVTR